MAEPSPARRPGAWYLVWLLVSEAVAIACGVWLVASGHRVIGVAILLLSGLGYVSFVRGVRRARRR